MANKDRYDKKAMLLAIQGDPDAPYIEPEDEGEKIARLFEDDRRKSSYGNIATIASRLVCSDQTVRNYLNRSTQLAQSLQAAVDVEKERKKIDRADFHHSIISKAEKGLEVQVEALNLNAIKYVLSTLAKDHYATRQEMTGADGAILLKPIILQLLGEMGIGLSDAVNEFEILVQQMHKESMVERGENV